MINYKPEKLLTEYSNRFRILEDFTKKFIELNDYKSKVKFIILRKGLDDSLINFFIHMYKVIDTVSVYLKIFLDEEIAKRRNSQELQNKKQELNKINEEIYDLIVKMESIILKENLDDKLKKRVSKEILIKIEEFIDLISEINTLVGLFTDKVFTTKTKSEDNFKIDFKVN